MQTIVVIPRTEEEIRRVCGMTKLTEEEKWKHISKLSEIRSKYSCFEDNEEPYYRALSEGIKALKTIPSAEPRTGHWILQSSNKEQGERDFIWWKCSECGQVIFSETEKDRREYHAFCGKCGAKMD